MPLRPDFGQAWMRQWREAARALDEQRRRELAALTPEKGLAASEALLAMAAQVELSPSRRTHSGLVEQQAIFHRRSRP